MNDNSPIAMQMTEIIEIPIEIYRRHHEQSTAFLSSKVFNALYNAMPSIKTVTIAVLTTTSSKE